MNLQAEPHTQPTGSVSQSLAQAWFSDTRTAFEMYTSFELKKAALLFKLLGVKSLSDTAAKLASWGIKVNLPIAPLVKHTVYKQFCAGETLNDCENIAARMKPFNVNLVLDYAVEHCLTQKEQEDVAQKVTKIFQACQAIANIPFGVLKLSALFSPELLEKQTESKILTPDESTLWTQSMERLKVICKDAKSFNLPIMVDAEESWFQGAIDSITEDLMLEFNTKDKAWVLHTVQLYRKNRLEYMKRILADSRFSNTKLGFKLVRGAYMEKERERALLRGVESPICDTRFDTDTQYNDAVSWSLDNIKSLEVIVATHNQTSCEQAIVKMSQNEIAANNPNVFFAQLFGMGENLSFNLAKRNYNAAKYTPFGPLKSTLPYLTRRAEENSSVQGQVGREFELVEQEIKRRKTLN